MKPWLKVLAFVVTLAAMCAAPGPSLARDSRSVRASKLLASARRRIAVGTHDRRQFAITEMLEAAKLAPERHDVALALGRSYLEGDQLHYARGVARSLLARDSAFAGAWLLDGEVWRRHWLTRADPTDRDHAICSIVQSTSLAPRDPVGWMLLVPLLVDANEPQLALQAASFATRAAPNDPKAQALLAAAFQRVGDLATAEHWFERALPRLPDRERERYEDITPLLPSWIAERFGAMEEPGRERFIRRFWAGADPDPVSVENEARLEYWARVTQALALYGTPLPGEWDLRAQYYVRFGAPAYEELNPIDLRGADNIADRVSWNYRDFGLRVSMASSSAFVGYSAPLSGPGLQAWADHDSLDRRSDLVPVYGGYAVFHRLPAGMAPLDARLALARFHSDRSTNLFAQVEAAGGLEEQLTLEWAVLDSAFAPIARDRLTMSASACGVDHAKAASFTVVLPPGRYRVGAHVSDGVGPRAVLSRDIVVSPTLSQLALSDLVITCGPPAQSVVAGAGIRLEPVTGLVPIAGDRLNAYVEIYGLAQSGKGGAQFSYECVVRPIVKDRRGWMSRMFAPLETAPPIRMSRSETTVGALRRQFLSVPVGALPAGPYEIEVLVRDFGNGGEVRSVASFERGH